MDSDKSERQVTIISSRKRLLLFCKIYKKSIMFLTIPLIFLPVAIIGGNDAYFSFYAFLITTSYWIFEVLHPAVISLIPIALSTVMNCLGYEIISIISVRHALFDCFGMLMIIVAVEDSLIPRRLALKTLLTVGYAHYRLSFLIYFSTMFLSMWISNTVACGLMLPIVKATMMELEKMGVLELYDTREVTHDQQRSKNRLEVPTDFTVFYFLGIAYSSTVGGLAAVVGSHTNQVFKAYSESAFPFGPKIEFPQFVLLTLPGVLVLETAVYLWMNFYFLGLFRIHNYSALHTGSTQEEAQLAKTLMNNQYQKLGKITNKEVIISVTILLCGVLQMTTSRYLCKHSQSYFNSHIQISAPTVLCAVMLCILPTSMDFLKFRKKQSDQGLDSLPSTASKPCLDWQTLRNEIHWSVLLVTGGSCVMFEALKQSRMTDEFEIFLRMFGEWSPVFLALVVVVFCKVLTESANNICVVHCILDYVTKVSLSSRVNPHYLMLATILSSSVPFHLITGTPANAMVSSYFHISHRQMIYAGIGPTISSVLIIWFTVIFWSKAIWIDINVFPDWANSRYNNLTMIL